MLPLNGHPQRPIHLVHGTPLTSVIDAGCRFQWHTRNRTPQLDFEFCSPQPICPPSRNRTSAPTAFNIILTTQYRSPQFISITPRHSLAKPDPRRHRFERGAPNLLTSPRFRSSKSSSPATSSILLYHRYPRLSTAISDGAHEMKPRRSILSIFDPPTYTFSIYLNGHPQYPIHLVHGIQAPYLTDSRRYLQRHALIRAPAA
jgi:hypothetical protein